MHMKRNYAPKVINFKIRRAMPIVLGLMVWCLYGHEGPYKQVLDEPVVPSWLQALWLSYKRFDPGTRLNVKSEWMGTYNHHSDGSQERSCCQLRQRPTHLRGHWWRSLDRGTLRSVGARHQDGACQLDRLRPRPARESARRCRCGARWTRG